MYLFDLQHYDFFMFLWHYSKTIFKLVCSYIHTIQLLFFKNTIQLSLHTICLNRYDLFYKEFYMIDYSITFKKKSFFKPLYMIFFIWHTMTFFVFMTLAWLFCFWQTIYLDFLRHARLWPLINIKKRLFTFFYFQWHTYYMTLFLWHAMTYIFLLMYRFLDILYNDFLWHKNYTITFLWFVFVKKG